MRIEITRLTNWSEALNSARFTQRKKAISGEPSINWKKKLIEAEHSPLRCVMYNIDMYDIPRFISDQYVRHKHAEPFVSTGRSDVLEENLPRDKQKMTDLYNTRLFLNAEEIINISRKRLCNKAETPTRIVWKAVLNELKKIDPELVDACIPNCIYRGFCPEMKSCGFANSEIFNKKLEEYRNESMCNK